MFVGDPAIHRVAVYHPRYGEHGCGASAAPATRGSIRRPSRTPPPAAPPGPPRPPKSAGARHGAPAHGRRSPVLGRSVADSLRRTMAVDKISVQAAGIMTVVILSLFMASSGTYLVARQGALLRFRDHRPAGRSEMDAHFAGYDPDVTVLVPSCAEEVPVMRATLWSAALQEPRVRIVLLLDDPPQQTDPIAVGRRRVSAAACGLGDATAAIRARRGGSQLAGAGVEEPTGCRVLPDSGEADGAATAAGGAAAGAGGAATDARRDATGPATGRLPWMAAPRAGPSRSPRASPSLPSFRSSTGCLARNRRPQTWRPSEAAPHRLDTGGPLSPSTEVHLVLVPSSEGHPADLLQGATSAGTARLGAARPCRRRSAQVPCSRPLRRRPSCSRRPAPASGRPREPASGLWAPRSPRRTRRPWSSSSPCSSATTRVPRRRPSWH